MYINQDIDYLKYLENKKILLFGAGENGKNAFYKLNKWGEIVGFCDNDKNKQGKMFCGISVISFEQLCQINNSELIIIICSNFEREIKYQMLNKNIYNFISMMLGSKASL